jgi:hypothetical protein
MVSFRAVYAVYQSQVAVTGWDGVRKSTGICPVLSLRGGMWCTRVIIRDGRGGARTPDLTDVNHHAGRLAQGSQGARG